MESASDILNEVMRRYAACPSYRDRGEVVQEAHRSGRMAGVYRWRQPFWTLFRRGDGVGDFRFEYHHAYPGRPQVWEREVMGCHGGKVWGFSTSGVCSAPSREFGMAIAGMTGVSGGVAHVVPSLLLPEHVRGRRLPGKSDVRVDGTEEVRGEECWVVGVVDAPGWRDRYFISRERWMIRRRVMEHGPRREIPEEERRAMEKVRREFAEKYPGLELPADEDQEQRSVSVTEYEAEMGGEIGEEELERDMPRGE